MARAGVGEAIPTATGQWPWATFIVNAVGALVLGWVATRLAPTRAWLAQSLGGDVMLLVGTGLLGGYTTFSTWTVETQRLGEARDWMLLWLYLFGSMLAGLAAAGGGWLLAGLGA